MSYQFGKRSKRNLLELDPKLQLILNELITMIDVTISTGHRDEAEQNRLYREGFSKVQWPDSKHNVYPAQAVDVEPWPIDYSDVRRYYIMAGMIKHIAKVAGISIRWGGDWDGDGDLKDQSFNDLAHFELL